MGGRGRGVGGKRREGTEMKRVEMEDNRDGGKKTRKLWGETGREE